jgi:hypothetical protein
MRRPHLLFLFVVALCASAVSTRAYADDRTEARTHYQTGMKFYNAGDYKLAIKEFTAAQQLAPADLNNYNLGLCYDKLGEGEPAIQYYREYLNKVPDAPKRAEIEASIARLDGALKSQSAKKAEEQKKIDDAKAADEAKKKAATDAAAKKTAEEQKAADAARAAEEAKRGAPLPDGSPTGVGSTGTPSTGLTVSTGDAQLDRVQGMDINAIRDQRIGGASSGLPDRSGGPATMPNGAAGAGPNGPATGANNMQQGAVGANGMAPAANATGAAGAPPPQTGPQGDKPAPKEDPVYKKWWFWAVVAVGAIVVYEIATTNANNSPNVGRLNNHEVTTFGSPGAVQGPASGGFTMHF